jgi:hypothetical protein
MLYLSRCYLRGDFSLELWAPVLLTGTILLDPRIVEYDVAPITIPMALLLWRFVRDLRAGPSAGRALTALLVLANLASIYSWEWRKILDGVFVLFAFAAGCWSLQKRSLKATPVETLVLAGSS